MKRSLTVIIDLQCYYPHGHWFGSVEKFAEIQAETSDVEIWLPFATKEWPSVAATRFNKQFILGIPSKRLTRSEISIRLLEESSRPLMKSVLKLFMSPITFVLLLLTFRKNPFNIWGGLNKIQTERRLVKHFVIPTADNFPRNLVALVWALCKTSATIHLRFVNSEPFGTKLWSVIIPWFQLLFGGRIKIAVEHQPLIKMFSKIAKKINVAPYPATLGFEVDTDYKFANSIGLLGAPRESKGYSSYIEIITQLLKTNPNFVISVQPASGEESKFRNLSRRVRVLNSNLSAIELTNEIKSKQILVLPYNRESYRNTSSAMLMEAAELGTMVVCPNETGLGFDVDKYKLGSTYNNLDQIPSLIEKLLEPDKIYEIRRNLNSFNLERNRQVREWLS